MLRHWQKHDFRIQFLEIVFYFSLCQLGYVFLPLREFSTRIGCASKLRVIRLKISTSKVRSISINLTFVRNHNAVLQIKTSQVPLSFPRVSQNFPISGAMITNQHVFLQALSKGWRNGVTPRPLRMTFIASTPMSSEINLTLSHTHCLSKI